LNDEISLLGRIGKSFLYHFEYNDLGDAKKVGFGY
jgi:hypothetical protein